MTHVFLTILFSILGAGLALTAAKNTIDGGYEPIVIFLGMLSAIFFVFALFAAGLITS